ncbi:MAG TPA: MATE family efflux transporter [Clostridia bacterium]|jgi:putative MATE family efflux protein|nr:MATE family efflux transporter [Clostridia bacterium]
MQNRSERLGTEKISKLLLNLSLPATVGMLVNALYNVVDTIFIGRGVGSQGIGGLAIAFPIQIIILAFALTIGVGAASAVSRSLGANEREKANKAAGNAFLGIIILSSAFSIFGLLFVDPLLRIFGATETLLPYARDYISVIFLGSVFYSFAVAANNLIRAEGNAKTAMFSMIIGTGLNIILDPIFIYPLEMGIKGAAWATIISQFCSFIYVLVYLYSGKSVLRVKFQHLKLEREILREIFSVGSASFVRQISGSIVAMVLNNSLKFYGGDLYISILGIVNKVIAFLSMPVFGVVQGMQPIAGFNYGAGKVDRIRETVKLSLITTIALASSSWLICEIFAPQVVSIFTDDGEIITKGSSVMRVAIAMIPVIGIQVVGAGLFQALGKAFPSLLLSMLRQVLLFIPLALILPRIFNLGLWGIWLAFPAADLSATLITAFFTRNQMEKLVQELKPKDVY